MMVFVNYVICKKIGVMENTYKYKSLDGLRGLCAALVVFHHFYWRNGSSSDKFWSVDYLNGGEKLLALIIGQLPVALFFMISGFLFYFVSVSQKPVFSFLKGRVFRIYPPVLISLIIAAFSLIIIDRESVSCATGVLKYIPTPVGFASSGSVCEFDMGPINSGILWTLIWEWRLYVFVPVLMILLRYIRSGIFVIGGLFFVTFTMWLSSLLDEMQSSCIALFLSGFISAILSSRSFSESQKYLLFFGGGVLFLISLFITKRVYNPFTAVSLIPLFLSIASGFSMFGILVNKKMQLLGVTSFSFYLNHGAFQFISKHFFYDYGFYIWQTASVIMVCISAPFLYKYVEMAFQIKKRHVPAEVIKP